MRGTNSENDETEATLEVEKDITAILLITSEEAIPTKEDAKEIETIEEIVNEGAAIKTMNAAVATIRMAATVLATHQATGTQQATINQCALIRASQTFGTTATTEATAQIDMDVISLINRIGTIETADRNILAGRPTTIHEEETSSVDIAEELITLHVNVRLVSTASKLGTLVGNAEHPDAIL